MSTRRRSLGVYSSPVPLGPNGERLCRNCRGPMPSADKRLHNCSPKCSREWQCKTSPHLMRMAVFERDRGVCALCGRDTLEDFRQKAGIAYRSTWRACGAWEADHIVPVIEGGGECGIEGYRTLCTDCHHKVTKELRARLAEKRAAEKLAPLQKRLRFGDITQIEAAKFAKRRARTSPPALKTNLPSAP